MRRLSQRTRPGWVSIAAILVGATGAITIFNPELTTRAARAVGIARGADLLTYIVALAFLASWFYFYQKVRTLSNAVTALVRELAIRDPRLPVEGASGDVAAPVRRGTEGTDPHTKQRR